MFAACLLTTAVLSTRSAVAAPIIYNITFTPTGGLAPVSGNFTYDAAVPAFTNFFVVWSGSLFDLTSSANNPLVYSTNPSCLVTSPATTFTLLSGGCGPIHYYADDFPFGGFENVSFEIVALPNSDPTVSQFYEFGNPSETAEVVGDGTLLIQTQDTSPTPEPGTGAIMLAGVACLFWRVRRSRVHLHHQTEPRPSGWGR